MTSQSVALLGRQPALGLAELESLYGPDNLSPLGNQAALINSDVDIDFNRLGGTIKLAKLLIVLDTIDWRKIEQFLSGAVATNSSYLPEGKMSLGLSAYGLQVKPDQINTTGLKLKKIIKATGRPVRVVPNKTADLSSAQVLHNNLTGQRAWELMFIRQGSQTYIAQTVYVQDINAYAARDQKRPKRDARVGMLPPKLAQIIINLATGQTNNTKKTVLDPFCGTGVILQEASLVEYTAYGSDIDPRMIEYSQSNWNWLELNRPVEFESHEHTAIFELGDATNHIWKYKFDTLASETYLGRPFSTLPDLKTLDKVVQDVDTIHKKFLKNLAAQTKSGFRMCIAVPAWKNASGFRHLPILDHLTDMGYTRLSFAHAKNDDLIYHRDGQVVARELVVLTRK